MKNIFKDKKILITGCTGFTGAWLILYLKQLDAKIYGYSKKPPFRNSMFSMLNLKNEILFKIGNVENLKSLELFYKKIKPDVIFHLAANPLVRNCYKYPFDAFLTNSVGTLNLLDIIKRQKTKKKLSLNIVTTDKVYRNLSLNKKFKETDNLGGEDPYSASKVCAEIICESYFKSYLDSSKISMNVLRSGNIIGGGDWSKDRLIPDIINSFKKKKKIILRNPYHTRPWQHIFDVIYSYCQIAKLMYTKDKNEFQTWNIAPLSNKNYTVKEIVKLMNKKLNSKIPIQFKKSKFVEKKMLSLNSNKLNKKLGIKNKISVPKAINLTVDWYLNYFNKNDYFFSRNQLIKYINDEKKF